MLLDKIIKEIENKENSFRTESNKDPSIMLSFLININMYYSGKSSESSPSFDFKISFLENQINRLILIVRRLRKHAKLSPVNIQNTKTNAYAEIDIESFFHFTYSILNNIARLTSFFYPSKVGVKTESFHEQKKFFLKPDNRNIDQEYSKYLFEETSWVEDDFKTYREILSHHHPPMIVPTKDGFDLVIRRKEQNKKTGEWFYHEKIPIYTDKIANKLLQFIEFYNKHFSKELQDKS